MTLHLTQSLLERIAEHARDAYPGECCGLLLGLRRDGQRIIHEVINADNAVGRARAAQRYEIAGQAYLHADRHARARGWDVLGIYHSHPDAPPIPSRTDLAEAWPEYVYLIVHVADGTPGAARAWTLGDDRFDELPLTVAAGERPP